MGQFQGNRVWVVSARVGKFQGNKVWVVIARVGKFQRNMASCVQGVKAKYLLACPGRQVRRWQLEG